MKTNTEQKYVKTTEAKKFSRSAGKSYHSAKALEAAVTGKTYSVKLGLAKI